MLNLNSRIKLNDGNLIPPIGLGLFKSPLEGKTKDLVIEAVRVGYSLFDTAEIYRNENEIGGALKENLCRENLFLTTKILRTNDGRRGLRKSLRKSLTKLGIDFVDLYLIHSPSGGRVLEVFDEMIEMKKNNFIRSIGVSNFGVEHLNLLYQNGFIPSVNQIELHPWCQNQSIVEFCRLKNIQLIAFSPLAKGIFFEDIFIKNLAEKYQKTPAQILLRWSIENGFIPIPKTSSNERLKENLQIFDFQLNQNDFQQLTEYGKQNQTNVSWNPTTNRIDQFGPIRIEK